MRFLPHLVRKDVRRFRLLLGAWLLVVSASAIVAGTRPALMANPEMREMVSLAGDLLWLTELLLIFGIVALVIHAHPAVGTDAFWMTRPIPPRTLVASKAVLLAAALVAAPLLARGALMAAYDMPPASIVAVAAERALFQALWVTLLASAAALTPNLPRFALLCSGALLTIVLVIVLLAVVMDMRAGAAPFTAGGETTEDPTPALIGTIFVIASGLALLLVQYENRSRRRSIATGAGGLLVAVGVASVWPWPLLAPRLEVPAWARSESALQVMAASAAAQIHEEPAWFERRSPWRLLRAPLEVAGIEPGWSADVGLMEATLHLDRNTSLRSAIRGHPMPVPVDDSQEHPRRRAVRQMLDVQHLYARDPPGSDASVLFFLREEILPRVTRSTGVYRGRFLVRLTRHEIEATLPLRRGATHRGSGYRLAIGDIELKDGLLSVIASESKAASFFERRAMPHFEFYLRDRRSGAAIEGRGFDPAEPFSLSTRLPFTIQSDPDWGFRIRALVITFSSDPSGRGGAWPLPDGWLPSAELIVVRSRPEGAVERTLELAELALPSVPMAVSAPAP